MKNAPFYIGQKVVCVSGKSQYVKKGTIHHVIDLLKTSCCDVWYINVGILNTVGGQPLCPRCERAVNHSVQYLFHDAEFFAPIEENNYEDVRKELARLPVDEVPDVKKIRELVN